jgi:hypothetical protein
MNAGFISLPITKLCIWWQKVLSYCAHSKFSLDLVEQQKYSASMQWQKWPNQALSTLPAISIICLSVVGGDRLPKWAQSRQIQLYPPLRQNNFLNLPGTQISSGCSPVIWVEGASPASIMMGDINITPYPVFNQSIKLSFKTYKDLKKIKTNKILSSFCISWSSQSVGPLWCPLACNSTWKQRHLSLRLLPSS